jgi:hypothetical protein
VSVRPPGPLNGAGPGVGEGVEFRLRRLGRFGNVLKFFFALKLIDKMHSFRDTN